MPSLSVVVPAFNLETYLGRCLRSLREQDLGPEEYEIIVVDDGSTDGSLAVAREHEAADPRIRVISQTNQGLSAARNAGTDVAKGRFLYYVDGDDFVVSGALPPVVDVMLRHRLEVARVAARKLGPDEPVEPTQTGTKPSPPLELNTGIDYVTRHNYPPEVWWYVFDRAFLARTGVRFEVGRYLEDGIFIASVLAAASRVAVIEQDVYRYVRRPGSIMRDSDPTQAARLMADFERVVFGLEELRVRTIADGLATPGFLDRIRIRQESYVFFMLARFVLAPIPVRPTLPQALARLQAGGFYPMTRFPANDMPGMRYRTLTTVFNRRFLLYPLVYTYRAADTIGLRLPKPGR